MRFPPNTPPVVREAILRYARRRTWLGVAAALGLALGLSGLAAAAFIAVDRLAEWPLAARQAGPTLVLLLLAAGLAASAAAVLRRQHPRAVAIRLDRLLPHNQDRWATALDLAERENRLETPGHPAFIKRLYRETEEKTTASDAPSVLSARTAALGFGLVLAALLAFTVFRFSDFFDLPLLWNRFWHPSANLPRDSLTQIQIVGHDPLPLSLSADSITVARVPEHDTFSLKVELHQRGGGAGQPALTPAAAPRLEILRTGGPASSADFLPSGNGWIFTRPDLTEPIFFRVRAGDALTPVLAARVEPRIQITALLQTIRSPSYARIPDVVKKPLETERLTLLEESWIDFIVQCNAPIRDLDATYELLEARDAEAAPALTPQEQWLQEWRKESPGDRPQEEKRRSLKVKIRRDHTAAFRLKTDHSGILRVRATGENGLPGIERVCVIEAVRDAPPRIAISGIEPDTSIVPGEIVGYQFTAEDDLAVSDIIMEWDVAGGARSGDLFGEEYIKSDQFGQRVVSGQDAIQRMNYFVYGTVPFVFTLIAVDSKGQESRSASYRIHLLSDTYASRFEAGLEFLKQLEGTVGFYRGHFQELRNQLRILSAAAGPSRTWPPGQDKLLEQYLKSAAALNPGLQRERARHAFSGWPQRFLHSTALLLALQRCLDTDADYIRSATRLREAQDLGAEISALDARLADQMALNENWGAALAGERQRFAGEAVLQSIRNLRQRLARLPVLRPNRSLYDSNLRFYRDEIAKALNAIQGLEKSLAEGLGPLVQALREKLPSAGPDEIGRDLRAIERQLAAHAPPLSPALAAALGEVGRRARTDPAVASRLLASAAETAAGRESENTSPPLEDLALCRAWMQNALPETPPWYAPPPDILDVWLMADRLRSDWQARLLDIEMKRDVLNPDQADDTEAELREQALVILDLLARPPGIAPESAGHLTPPLQAAARGEISDPAGRAALAQLRAALGQIEPAGRARLLALQPSLDALPGEIQRSLESAAEGYLRFAAEAEAQYAVFASNPESQSQAYYAWAPFRHRAEELQAAAKALEIAYRKSLFLKLLQRLGGPSPSLEWVSWHPWHALQLILLIDSEHAFDKVTYRFNATGGSAYALLPAHARGYANQLRLHAPAVARAGAGQPLDFDLQPLLQDTRTLGYFESLQQELETTAPFLGPAQKTPRQEILQRLEQTLPGRIGRNEITLQKLLSLRIQMGRPGDRTPERLLPAIQEVRQVLERHDPVQDLAAWNELQDALTTLPGDARNQPLPKAIEPTLHTALSQLDGAMKTFFSAVQIPPVNMTRRSNQRDYSAVARTFWPIAGVIDNFDRRWMQRLREAEFSLVRQILLSGDSAPSGANDRAAAMAYARLVEFRARQLAQERRKNRGISYLDEASGPALNLPPHIAQEFLRARNRRPPAAFKDRTEAYFRDLYRDLAR